MEQLELKPVESTNIKSVGYSEEIKTMVIEFHNGTKYQYEPVTLEGYNNLINAESISSFFYKNIRNNTNITTTKL